MTSTRLPSPPDTPLDRFVDWILDKEGQTYGDERERLRWYEGIAAVATIQWILVPWALAIMVWIGDDGVAWYLLAALMVFSLPTTLAGAYVTRNRVRRYAGGLTRKRLVATALGSASYIVFVAGLIFHTNQDSLDALLVGGIVLGVEAFIGIAVYLRKTRREQARETSQWVGRDADE